MAVDIRWFIQTHLLEPLKLYPTRIQDTMIEMITQKLMTLYEYTYRFPEIVSPNQSRLDILKAIADQFLFTVRDDADIQEQIDILTNILYVYNRRGSIDTIENMWEYYGGTLPKEVKVIIPSYNLFRYSISKLSGTHVFQDDEENRTGTYEIRLTNNTYPIPELKQFLIKELVAAGNRIYFTNSLLMSLLSSLDNSYKYEVIEDDTFYIQMQAVDSESRGLKLSGKYHFGHKGDNTKWSGRKVLQLEVDLLKSLGSIGLDSYKLYDSLGIVVFRLPSISSILYRLSVSQRDELSVNSLLYCTSSNPEMYLSRNLYDSQGEIVENQYSGYFIVGKSLLGEEVV